MPHWDDLAVTPTAHGFGGIAADARVVSIKVGAADDAVDATQVIAAIDWAVQHRTTNGMNIRVLTLANGVASSATATTDALSHAVENARRNGIVVVASSGNDGTTNTDLAFPARNPDVIAVGAANTNGSTLPTNWSVADFADRGTKNHPIDLVAPGVNVQGLRVPGSVIDSLAPSTTGDRFERGSGTSQAAAIVAGLAAQLIQRYPTASADQIKAMLQTAATPIKAGTSSWSQGSGAIVATRLLVAAPTTPRTTPFATTGTAPINSDRIDQTGASDSILLTGEFDVQGNPWVAPRGPPPPATAPAGTAAHG